MTCPLCDEALGTGPTVPLYTQEGPRQAHQECMLREVIGGIGHLIDHAHFCGERHDPDAGLSRRLSSLLVFTYIDHVGLDETVRTSTVPIPPTEEPHHAQAPQPDIGSDQRDEQ